MLRGSCNYLASMDPTEDKTTGRAWLRQVIMTGVRLASSSELVLWLSRGGGFCLPWEPSLRPGCDRRGPVSVHSISHKTVAGHVHEVNAAKDVPQDLSATLKGLKTQRVNSKLSVSQQSFRWPSLTLNLEVRR